MTITLVAAVAKNGVIGRDGAMPWHLPADLIHFKQLTLGHVLIMGRRTYESIGRALPGRTTIVVTRQPDWHAENVRTAGSLGDALEQAGRLGEIFVVGGADVYAAALPIADRLVLTHVDAAPSGDRFFPVVDWSRWMEQSRVAESGFHVSTYVRAESSSGH